MSEPVGQPNLGGNVTRVPWDGAPVSPDARMFFAGETKIVVNPDSVVWFPAGDVEATVHLKPVDLGYDEFERLIESNPHEATIALRNGRHARLCLTYWLNKNPRFYTAGEEEPQIGFTDGDGIWVLEREGDAHERFIREWQRGMSWNQQLQRAGARYMNDWKNHPVAKRIVEEELDRPYHRVDSKLTKTQRIRFLEQERGQIESENGNWRIDIE